MRNRNIGIRLWLNDAEATTLAKKAASCKLSRSAYLRFIINDFEPKQSPSIEYYQLLRELRAIGNNMRQIAHKAHALGMIETPLYHQNADRLNAVCSELMSAVLPTKSE
jgi:hypothetical protein